MDVICDVRHVLKWLVAVVLLKLEKLFELHQEVGVAKITEDHQLDRWGKEFEVPLAIPILQKQGAVIPPEEFKILVHLSLNILVKTFAVILDAQGS